MEASAFKVEKIVSREVLDSRGNPTVQVDLHTKSGFGQFSVPSGASKGHLEALELRDGERQRYNGLGVQKALENIGRVIAPKILGLDSRDQLKIDRILNELDGTENKSKLGANAILGISIALARASADTANSPLYRTIADKRRKTRRQRSIISGIHGYSCRVQNVPRSASMWLRSLPRLEGET